MRPTTSSRSSRLLQIATIMLALAASACGGGGGGGTVTPPGGGGGGGGPTPTPAPTGSPGATPTPAHTATPGPTPTPGHSATPIPTQSPTAPPTGNTFLPNTTGRIGLIQILDNYTRGGFFLSSSDIATEAPNYDSVWGAFQPSTWRQDNPHIFLSRYYMPVEDNSLVSGNNLQYFLTNYPDWILYGCDSNGNPTSDYAWSGTSFPNDTPLDIENPNVVAYQLGTIATYLRQNGYNALAIDNVTFFNYLMSPNTILESKPANHGWYGCGHYTNGPGSTFVREYGSGTDSHFTADILNWVKTAKQTLAPLGIKVIVNHPPGSPSDPNEQALLGNIDGLLDEGGFIHYGSPVSSGTFAATINWMNILQSRGIAVLISNYYCFAGKNDPQTGQPCGNSPQRLTASEVDFGLASYAIGNNGGADVSLSPNGGAVVSFRPEYSQLRYGSPCPGSYAQNGNVFTRRFTGGMAIVNDSASPTSVALPAGHSYTDIEKGPVSSPVQLGAFDGYMLMTSGGNGCS